MLKVLVTGFESFGNIPINPSQKIIEYLDKLVFVNDFDLKTALLPVSFNESESILWDLIQSYQPDLYIATGVDLSKKNIELETTAHKNIHFLNRPFLKKIHPQINFEELPQNYSSSIDLFSVCDSMNRSNLKTVVSDDTGLYVCNHVYYFAQLLKAIKIVEMQSCFIHVPYPYPYYEKGIYVIPEFTIEDIHVDFLEILMNIVESRTNHSLFI